MIYAIYFILFHSKCKNYECFSDDQWYIAVFLQATSPYLTGIPANTYSPYYAAGHLVPTLLGPDPTAVASQLGPVVPQTVQVAQQKIPRSDRLEVSDSLNWHSIELNKKLNDRKTSQWNNTVSWLSFNFRLFVFRL